MRNLNYRVDAVTLAFDAMDEENETHPGLNENAFDDIYHNVIIEFGEDVAKRLNQVVRCTDGEHYKLKITGSDDRTSDYKDQDGNVIPEKTEEAIRSALENSDRDALEEWVRTGELPGD